MFSDFYKGRRVLLTGHTGFKGSWMALWLKLLGAEVYGYALQPKRPEDNFTASAVGELVHHHIGDVCDHHELDSYFKKCNPDVAFHFAAQPLVIDSYSDPRGTFLTNLMGTVHFFESVRNSKSVKVAINITSDKCYENNEWLWGYRENDAIGGRDPYSASKGCSEIISSSYLRSFFTDASGCKIATARAGNVIGGGDWAENRIVPDFFKAVLNDHILKIRNPQSTRPWQHVLEPLSGYLSLAQQLCSDVELKGAWNFGPYHSNNKNVATLVAGLANYCKKGRYEIEKNETQHHESNFLFLDISKAQSKLKWQPILDFEQTVQFTVEGYKHQMENRDLRQSRFAQIEEYHRKAKERGVSWAND